MTFNTIALKYAFFCKQKIDIESPTILDIGAQTPTFNINSFEKYNLKKPDKIELPNNHLQYALTWYSLCFVIIIAFLIYKRKI